MSKRPNKAPKARNSIAQGNALGKRAKKNSARGLDARAPELQSDLGKHQWACVSDQETVAHCTYDDAFAFAREKRSLGVAAIVMTDRAAARIHGFNELEIGNGQ